MPQMAPYSWLLMSLCMIFFLYLMTSMTHFFPISLFSKKFMKKLIFKKKSWNWKW